MGHFQITDKQTKQKKFKYSFKDITIIKYFFKKVKLKIKLFILK